MNDMLEIAIIDKGKKVEFSLSRKTYRGAKIELRSFLSSAIDGAPWLTSGPGRFTLGKEPRYSLNRRLGRPQSRFGSCGFQPLTIQPVAQSLY
jgi:hypothetical protein